MTLHAAEGYRANATTAMSGSDDAALQTCPRYRATSAARGASLQRQPSKRETKTDTAQETPGAKRLQLTDYEGQQCGEAGRRSWQELGARGRRHQGPDAA